MSKLLIVENNTDFAYVIDWHFQSLGMTVFSVATGSEAIAIYTAEKPDIILLDINLDGELDGKDVARKIRETDLDTPIIFMSGETNKPTDVIESYAIGCSHFLKKPVSLNELEMYVNNVLKVPQAPKVSQTQTTYRLNDTTIDIINKTLTFNSVTQNLSDKEKLVLHLLVDRLDKLVPFEQFFKTIWNNEKQHDALRNKISVLRKKLKGSKLDIKTEKSKGYKLVIE